MGERIPLTSPAIPGSLVSRQQVRSLARFFDVMLMGNHGPFSWGNDLEQAYLRLELAEHLADIQQRAQWMGTVKRIPERFIEDLKKARFKAGLGPEARGTVSEDTDLTMVPIEELIRRMVLATTPNGPDNHAEWS